MKTPLVGRADLLRAITTGVSPDRAAKLCGYEHAAEPEAVQPKAVSTEKPPERWEELPMSAPAEGDKKYTLWNLAPDSELAAMRAQNNPRNEPTGPYTGRCRRCGSNDLWDDNLAYGCNACGALLGTN